MTAWLIETGLAVTLLMLLVLAARRPVAHFFGAGWAYALWLLPLLRLVLPHFDLFDMPSLLPQAAVSIPAGLGTAAPPPLVGGPDEWVPTLLATWAGGAAIFFLWQQASYAAFLLSLGRKPYEGDGTGGIPIIQSHAVDGPVAVGILRRRIVVPVDFAVRYTPAERRLALEHELIHHRRGDLWWNLAAVLVLGLNWFNPVAWFAFRAFRADQELSCDAAVAARVPSEARHDYARALVKSASRPGLIATCPLNEAGQLKQRLRMMKTHRSSALRSAGGSAAVAMLLAGGLGVTQSAAAPEPAPVQMAAALPVSKAPRPPSPMLAPTAPNALPALKALKSFPLAPKPKAPPEAPPAPAAPAPVEVAVAAPPPPAALPEEGPPMRFAMLRRLDGPAEVRIVRVQMDAPRPLTPEMRQKVEEMVRLLHAAGAGQEERQFVRIIERKEI